MRARFLPFVGLSSFLLFACGCNAFFGIDSGHADTGGGGAGTSTTTDTGGTTATGGTGGTTSTSDTGGTTATGGTGGSPSCTPNAVSCEGAVLHACDANGSPKPDVTCDAVAGCDAAAGKCVGADAFGRIAVGAGRGCAIEDDRKVRCWGVRGGGAIFVDPPLIQSSAIEVPGVTARQVSLGYMTQCALQDDGSVVCWGNNDNGQLGYPPGNSQMPQTVPALPAAVEVRAGSGCTCARLADGTVDCWGRQDDGCLGTAGTVMGNQPVPTPVPGVTGAVQLSISVLDAPKCARLATGGVTCWSNTVAPKAVPGVTDAVDVASGYRHVIIRSASKGLLWTGPTDDQLDWRPAATYVAGSFTTMASGGQLVARKSDGTLVSGDLSNSTQPDLPAPVPGVPSGDIVELAAGCNADCSDDMQCLRLGGEPMSSAVYCWGDDEYGGLGAGGLEYFSTPQNVPGVSAIQTMSVSQRSTSLILGDGSLSYWGQARGLMAGVSATPTTVPLVDTDNSDVTTADIWAEAYIRKANGSALFLEAGIPSATAHLFKTGYPDLVQLKGFGHFDIAMRFTGELVVYTPYDTSNVDGILGNGTFTATPDTNTVVPLPGSGLAVDYAAYGDDYNGSPAHICAILTDTTLACWGHNYLGEIGNGMSGDPVPVPTNIPVPGNQVVGGIAAGANFNCMLPVDGKVYCWGWNDRGQLGIPNLDHAFTPLLPVSGLMTVQQISARSLHACAVLENKTVRCWGANDYGQLGNGTFKDSALPVQPVGLQNVADVQVGPDHTCARRLDGSVACWGSSYWGQVGTGLTGNFVSPLQVLGL